MTSSSLHSALEPAAIVAALLFVLSLCISLWAWCWRMNRRLRRLEDAARRFALEQLAVPRLIDDCELPEITLPRFIGSPYPTQKRTP